MPLGLRVGRRRLFFEQGQVFLPHLEDLRGTVHHIYEHHARGDLSEVDIIDTLRAYQSWPAQSHILCDLA